MEYGGSLTTDKENYLICPKAGLNQRFSSTLPDLPVEIALDQDGFLSATSGIQIAKNYKKIVLQIENRSDNDHILTISIKNIPYKRYRILQHKKIVSEKAISSTETEVQIPIHKKLTSIIIQAE